MPLLSGKYIQSVDGKRRVNIPSTVISDIARAYEYPKDAPFIFHIVPGPHDCLYVYPREVFTQIAENLEKKFGSMGLDVDDDDEIEGSRFFSWLMSEAKPLTCDQQGRITVSQDHLDYADIQERVCVVGTVNKLEFWNPERYERFIQSSKYSKKDLIRRFGRADRG